ncbi:hypothetical protein B0H16DRAFT_1693461 [Mycena metata]|uniref:Uncharacterized protein n=1 Tax=Mycena metata TaxID=1033252 RepID=A0AAD7II13_9AGAR|nr:hypothetical protein B0H16DRAFT_1693461 [Mycena metata]
MMKAAIARPAALVLTHNSLAPTALPELRALACPALRELGGGLPGPEILSADAAMPTARIGVIRGCEVAETGNNLSASAGMAVGAAEVLDLPVEAKLLVNDAMVGMRTTSFSSMGDSTLVPFGTGDSTLVLPATGAGGKYGCGRRRRVAKRQRNRGHRKKASSARCWRCFPEQRSMNARGARETYLRLPVSTLVYVRLTCVYLCLRWSTFGYGVGCT